MDRKEMMNALETIRKACTGRCEECKFGTTEGACKLQRVRFKKVGRNGEIEQ